MLDAVHRIDGAIAIMEHQWQPLHVIEQPCSEIPYELLPGVCLQPPGRKTLDADQERDSKQYSNRRFQRSAPAAQPGHSVHKPRWERLRAQNTVNNNLERQGIKKREWKRKNAESGYSKKVRPATPRLLEHTKQNGFFPQ